MKNKNVGKFKFLKSICCRFSFKVMHFNLTYQLKVKFIYSTIKNTHTNPLPAHSMLTFIFENCTYRDENQF